MNSNDPDVQVLEQLVAAGADLSKSTHVVFFTWVGSEAGARSLADAMRASGLRAEILPPAADEDPWLCQFDGTFVPTLETIRAYADALESLCTAVGGEYDGWEAQVVS